MKVSVIIPVFNQVERLKIVLKAFNNQNYFDYFEVIVVNDGSTDNVEYMIKNLNINYRFIYKKLEKNSGRSIARNAGARMAKGDILIFCDGDRIPDNNFISEHIKSHLQHNIDIVVLGRIVELFLPNFDNKVEKYYKYDNIDKFIKFARDFNYYDYIEQMYDLNGNTSYNIAWISLFTSNFSISRELFFFIGTFDEDFTLWGFENFELGYRLSKMNVKYVLNRKAINFHIFHKADRTGSRRDKSFEIFKKKHPSIEVENLLEYLDGNISLQRFENISLNKDNEEIGDELFFNKNKLGKRYIV